MEELRILAPTGCIGYGFPEESLRKGLERDPDVIAADAGSTDPGPYFLGAGLSFTGRTAVKRDLTLLLVARETIGVPLIIGSAGGAGALPHLNWTIDIIKEVAKERKLRLRLARIQADVDKDFLKDELRNGRILSFESGSDLTIDEIDKSERIVAQMGLEPIIRALELDVDVVVAGRAYDPGVLAAFPVMKGYDKGLAIHMSKILECGCQAAQPLSPSDTIIGVLRRDHFLVEPINRNRKCTTMSVAAHTLYEKDNPVKLLLPGGVLDLSESRFEQYDERTVKVDGSKFIEDRTYKVKLEGVKKIGYRTIFIAGIRDPIMINEIGNVLDFVRMNFKVGLADVHREDYEIFFHVYGRNGVMGAQESVSDVRSHELGIVADVVGRTAEISKSICAFARQSMLHYDYPGRKANAGNLAFLFSPSDIQMDEVFEFNIYHLLKLDDPVKIFPIRIENV